MANRVVVLTGSGNWTVPDDWNNTNHSIACIGGGRGGGVFSGISGGGGGGGGAFALGSINLVQGDSIAYSCGAGSTNNSTAGGDTWFNASSLANAVTLGSSVAVAAQGAPTSGAGGLGSSSVGNASTANGGSGGAGANGGGGGGGAGGPNGNGNNGAAASSTNGGVGGSGDAGSGGAGGTIGVGLPGGVGGVGTEYSGLYGSGGGSGGSYFNTVAACGAGGQYGGGGGGSGGSAGTPGVAGNGVIIITYQPIPAGGFWRTDITDAIRKPRQLPTRLQQFTGFVTFDYGTYTQEERWLRPFSEPVRFRPRLVTANQQFASFVQAEPFGETIIVEKCFRPSREPTRFRTALRPMHTGAQQFASFVQFEPFNEVVSADRWFVPFSEPTRFRSRLITANHLFQFREEVPLSLYANQVGATLLGTASIRGVPTSNYKLTLSDSSRRVIYTAVISPWSVSDRNA